MQVLAFVPVRGGSKSILLKNIKLFCGQPLVYWCLKMLQASGRVKEIVVATDSEEIASVVRSFALDKVRIYRRLAANASNTASTESVMLEYLSTVELSKEDIFLLVQATSPLTETIHLEEALLLYTRGQYDSLLTCVRTVRFFWNADGTSQNYDYRHRPRRQECKGELMENGALYINRVGNILSSGNRLSGRIGIYEMPEHTGLEIDEPDDWAVLEGLMYKHKLSEVGNRKKGIKLVLTDVDGVLTDGGMYYSSSGEEMKKFNTWDGMGVALLHQAGIKTGIITSEESRIVGDRAAKLKVDHVCQGVFGEQKLLAAQEICAKEGLHLSEVAYIGDDINCDALLRAVGYAACPSDAADKIKGIPGILLLHKKGGEGVFREFVNNIIDLV
jgi:N-acylneuraminate cytidylyltransferase